MLLYRIITAVLLMAFATFLAFYKDGFLFPLLILVCHSGIFMEWLSLLNKSRVQKITGLVALIIIFALVINEKVSQNLLLALFFFEFFILGYSLPASCS